MTIEIRRIDPEVDGRPVEAGEAAVLTYVAIWNAVRPSAPTSLDEIRWEEARYPGGARFLGLLDGRPAGAGSTGRIRIYDAAYERYWLNVRVLPDGRRRGLGTALWVAASEVARAAGKTGFQTDVSEAETAAVAFLEHRGFRVTERSKQVRLDLRGVEPPEAAPPPGIVLTTLAERPDLEAGLHAVAVDGYPDIPSGGEPVAPGSLEEFLDRDIRRAGMPADGVTIALDQATGEVVGWASLLFAPGSTTIAWHDMTVVRPAWRGRGIATAIKRATIAWAIRHGLETLETGNDDANAPMRAVNARLGYQPIPDLLTMQGPLAPAAGSTTPGHG